MSEARSMEVKPTATKPAYQVVYKYPPLHTDGRWTRVVRLLRDSTAENLQCEMVQRRLTVDAGAGGYTAISYCWGSTQIQRQRTRAIEVNGETLMVSTVVEDLLMRLLDLETAGCETFYWIDYLSIDQDNTIEKELQVSRMADIFAAATQVIVSLGPHKCDPNKQNDAELAIQAINREFLGICRFDDQDGRKGTQDVLDYDSLTEATQARLLKMLHHPWFRRVWVLQEMAFAKSILIIAGSASIDGTHFARCLLLHKTSNAPTSKLTTKLNLLWPMIQWIDSRFSFFKYNSIFEALHNYRSWKATLACDKVYALQPFCSSYTRTKVDYGISMSHLFTQIACSAIRYFSSLSILAYREPRSARVLNDPVMPSWVPDWSNTYIAPWHDHLYAFGHGLRFEAESTELRSAKETGILRVFAHPVAMIITVLEDAESDLSIHFSALHLGGKLNRRSIVSGKRETGLISHFGRFLTQLHMRVMHECGDGFGKDDQVCILRGSDSIAVLRPAGMKTSTERYRLVHFEPDLIRQVGKVWDLEDTQQRPAITKPFRLLSQAPKWGKHVKPSKRAVEAGIDEFLKAMRLEEPVMCELV